MDADSWNASETFFEEFASDADFRGSLSRINLELLRGCRDRWYTALECYHVMGFGMHFSPRGAPYSTWVRVEPRVSDVSAAGVAISIVETRPIRPDHPATAAMVIGGDICNLPTAPVVLRVLPAPAPHGLSPEYSSEVQQPGRRWPATSGPRSAVPRVDDRLRPNCHKFGTRRPRRNPRHGCSSSQVAPNRRAQPC